MLDGSKAMVGKFYRPIKKPLTIRLDADVPAWLKAFHGMVGALGAALRPGMLQALSENPWRKLPGTRHKLWETGLPAE
jgi:hypothetical protein